MNTPSHVHAAGGSPLYQLSAEHVAALVALGVLVVAALVLRRRAAHVLRLAPVDLLLVALLSASAAIHVGLAVAHGDHGVGLRALLVIDAVLLGVVARRVARGSAAGRLGAAVLAGSIGGYWISVIGGEAPDQLGLATKLAETLALAIVLRPTAGSRWSRARSLAGAAAVVLAVIGTSTSSWIGSFRAAAAEPGAVAGHHFHAGGVAPPGTVLPLVLDREPSRAEQIAATDLVLTARTALARYADPAVAASDGYNVAGLAGIDFHASNPAYEKDDRILDPSRPETLVYAVAPDGRPVLLGAMFLMPKIGQTGPTIGGPLTVWHAHQHVCFSFTPPALAGVLSPLGMCPIGSIDVPLTPEMIHIWIVPGAPQPFGDLDDAWKRAYLETTVARP